jgi:hypothetical protein
MKRCIVYDCTERPAGGLADRIKGLVSCFGLSRLLDRDFIINWTYPYKLQSVLSCNTYNWLPRPVSGTHKQYFAIDNENYDQFKKEFNRNDVEIFFNTDISIIKTNINFLDHLGLENNFEDYFNQLFKEPELPFSTDDNTVGVCARFGGQLSNWNDSNFNRNISFDYIIEKITHIMLDNPTYNLFICTDSAKFAEFIKARLNVLITPNETEHMDRPGCSYQGFLKSFHDFFLLRRCGTIISTKGGFAHTAALSSGKKIIEI